MSFPERMDPKFYDQVYRRQSELWREPFLKLWRDKGPDPALVHEFKAFTDGSNLIGALGQAWVMKVFPPFLRHQWESEWRVMQHLDGCLALPIPRYYASGDRDGWTYIIMSRLPGVTLEKVWPRLDDNSKAVILSDIGSIMARVHAVPVKGLHDLPPPWSVFLPEQIEGCRARHERLGMPSWFLQQLDAFVNAAVPSLPQDPSPVILTGEYTPFNLLVADENRVENIAGMIDFGDAMIGYHEYDLLGPLLFCCEGKAALVEALLAGYGYAPHKRNKALRRRLMLLQVLHRYSNFFEQLRVPDWPRQVQSIEGLEHLIWPIS